MPNEASGWAGIEGIRLGHANDSVGLTGCSVVICPQGAIGGVSVRGWAPGTRELALLRPGMSVERVHAVLLTGGSAFGLAAADGVMRWLEEQSIGFATLGARVPIVPAAVLYDLGLGDPRTRPDAEMGYRTCLAATADEEQQGNVGAGMGASVGKLMGMGQATKAGLGLARLSKNDLIVAAIVAVNALGDVVDPADGRMLAGLRDPAGGYANSSRWLTLAEKQPPAGGNTVIGVVVTNANLSAAQANVVASTAHDGIARAVRPAHTIHDGDTLFVLSSGNASAPLPVIQEMATQAVARAIVNGVMHAKDAGGLPCATSLAR